MSIRKKIREIVNSNEKINKIGLEFYIFNDNVVLVKNSDDKVVRLEIMLENKMKFSIDAHEYFCFANYHKQISEETFDEILLLLEDEGIKS